MYFHWRNGLTGSTHHKDRVRHASGEIGWEGFWKEHVEDLLALHWIGRASDGGDRGQGSEVAQEGAVNTTMPRIESI